MSNERKTKIDLNDDSNDETRLHYGINETPPLITTLLFAVQQILICTTFIIVDPLIVSRLVCADDIADVRVRLISTVLFMCGIGTLLQNTVGIRLPLIQGASFAFLPPLAVFNQLYPCPNMNANFTQNDYNLNEQSPITGYSFAMANGEEGIQNEWQYRLSMVQGSLLVASLVQMTFGATGLVGCIVRYVGPLTTAPLMLMLGLSVVQLCVENVAKSWTSLVLISLLLLTALYLQPIKIAVPVKSATTGLMKITKKPIFALFPYLLAIAIVWSMSAILTITDVLPAKNEARTDIRSFVIKESTWFAIPYPGQWPQGYTLHTGLLLGFIASTLSSIVESIGDYHACARVVQAPPPPAHAVNRGIFIEGVGCCIGALLGGGTSLTTYSENIGAIGLTKVASRRVLTVAGILLISCGVITKVGAILATIPDPMIGAQLTISASIVAGVGLSSIQSIDLRLSRNVAILGIACFAGLMIPTYISQHPLWTSSNKQDTISDALLQCVNTLLQIQMFVAGIVGFVLDNTVPGATRTQRGLSDNNAQKLTDISSLPYVITTLEGNNGEKKLTADDVYNYPECVMDVLAKIPGIKYVPYMPKVEFKASREVDKVADVLSVLQSI